MNEITTVGLDLAKRVFHAIGCDGRGKEVLKKTLRRSQVPPYFANLPACLIGLEACAGADDWARQLEALRHEVRLIPAQHTKADLFGNKNDYAVARPDRRFVPVKTVEQRDLGEWRVRKLRCRSSTGSSEAVTRYRLPHNVACRFVALRSSEIDSQHSKGLKLPIGNHQSRSL